MSKAPPPSPLAILSMVAASSPRMESSSPSPALTASIQSSPHSIGSPLPIHEAYSPPRDTSSSPTTFPPDDTESQETVKQEDIPMDMTEDRSRPDDQDVESNASQMSTDAPVASTSSSIPLSSPKSKRVTGRKNIRNEAQRKAYLDEDPYAEVQDAAHVKCSACKQKIKLDNRKDRAYYSQSWIKHRDSCKKIPASERVALLEKDRERSQKLPSKRERLLNNLRTTLEEGA